MDKQRLRNLTTGLLHTETGHIYEDIEYITGEEGVMTHQLPNAMRAIEPWLREKVTDPEYWDGEYRPDLEGEHPLPPMSYEEREEMFERYSALPSPFSEGGLNNAY